VCAAAAVHAFVFGSAGAQPRIKAESLKRWKKHWKVIFCGASCHCMRTALIPKVHGFAGEHCEGLELDRIQHFI